MPCLLYAIGLVVCGAAISVQCHVARWGSEEPDWFGWPGVVIGAGEVVLLFNVISFIALAVLWQRAQPQSAVFRWATWTQRIGRVV